MTLQFNLLYHTQWGESLRLELLGEKPQSIALTTTDGHHWTGHLSTEALPEVLHYQYALWSEGKCLRMEHRPHQLRWPQDAQAEVQVDDLWNERYHDEYLFSAAFSSTQPHPLPTQPTLPAGGTIVRALVPSLSDCGQVLALVGEHPSLGTWRADRALRFQEIGAGHWQLTLPSGFLDAPSEYKLVRLSAKDGVLLEWENGPNRQLYPQAKDSLHFQILPQVAPRFDGLQQHLAGTAIPVFSLRSEGSQGVGDFGDLLLMLDWIVATGQRALQILPINDTTIQGGSKDSYPYDAISIYALHPMYIDLRQVTPLSDSKKQALFAKQWRQLNALPEVNYEQVNKLKRDYLRLAFRESGKQLLDTEDFALFYQRNAHWLCPYAVFSHCRDKYGTASFSLWPTHQHYDAQAIKDACRPDHPSYESVAFYFYLQYLLHLQLSAVSQKARQAQVLLKGDIPIGISRVSVEAWLEPHYFNLKGQAGAPPDAFAAQGQNWGFPTYNWEVMSQDGYRWWKNRFAHMADYFTAYRIDHILGFFRIWEIPHHSVQGLLGQFSPALPLSPQEIEDFGLHFQRDFMTRPFICDDILQRLFGSRSEWVKQQFLVHSHYDIWSLRPEFSTQRQVEAYLQREAHRLTDATAIGEGLYTLINNVLFVEDHKQRGHYHPRIAAQQAFIFERLQPEERTAFNRLYQHFFYERHNDFWYASAMKKLPALLHSSPMLACGEDLGMVPECVAWVMNELQILSLEIERMPKALYAQFGQVSAYPHHSVCTIGTHDMSTLRAWWEESPQLTARYYYEVLQRGGSVPTVAPGWVCESVVRQHLESPSLLCILALQDWLAIDEQLRLPHPQPERINVPSNPEHNWNYRMHLSIETLLRQSQLNQLIAQLIAEGGRAR